MNKRITATHFYNFTQCPHRLYLNNFEEKDEKIPISEFMQSKIDAGVEHEKNIVKTISHDEVKYSDDLDGFEQTMKLMREGKEQIYQGVLIFEDLLGRPDLLVKTEGDSNFGDYHYVASDIKSGKNLKKEYRVQIIFYNYLLKKIQGVMPEKAYVINSQNKKLIFNLQPEYNEFKESLAKIRDIFKNEKDSPYYLGSSCAECQWRECCLKQAIETNDLSLIFKLSMRAKDLLILQGINNIVDLAKKEPEDIELWKGVLRGTISKWILQARSLLEDKPIILAKSRFQEKRYEIFFDIEGETKLGIDYLYGMIVRDNETNSQKYCGFYSDKPEDEEGIWKAFLEELRKYDDFIIYYYTSYEVSSLKRMKNLYGCDEDLFNKIMDNFVDLFPILIRNVVLPIYSYSIKPVAKYLGFSWSNKLAGGTQSMYWYQKFLAGEKEYKEIITEYNHDDCKATMVLKDWLTNSKL